MAELMDENMDEFDDSEDEDNPVDDTDDDDNDEIFGDDEEERSDDEEEQIDAIEDEENIEIMEDNGDEEVRVNNVNDDEMQIDNDAAINVNDGLQREGRQETLFKGINTEGMRVPLQCNENIRAIDQLLVLLSRTIRHCNTYEQLLDELTWLKKSYRFINLPTNKPALWKTLGRNTENLSYELYCSKCKDQIGIDNVVERVCRCGYCGPELDNSHIATFVRIRLAPQLEDLLKTPNIAASLRYRDTRVKVDNNNIEDIFDGAKYKHLRNPGNFLSNENNFSLSLWTDGVKLTKSSPATSYPVILQLNELSPHARKQNMFLAGLWVSNSHPSMNSLLRPICRELRELYEDGISWRPNGDVQVISRFITTIFIADSVARPDALRMKRYNGRCGCTYCLAEGERAENTWVYRTGNYQLRSDASIREDGLLALQTGEIVNGVKGITALTRLPQFDLVEDVPVDCAHNTYLGVAKRLVVRWFSDANEEWYIGDPDSIAAIDAKLLSITPPTRISRSPRSILLYKMWKATEWRNWLLYYALPCLDGILPPRYVAHLEKLVKAIYILNSDSISELQLDIAQNLLTTFVEEYQTNYFLKNMVYNVHLLTHLVNCVRNWGPLWMYSSLPFESMNRRITDSVKSPYHKADQVVSRFFMKKFVILASRQLQIADVTREEVSRLLKIPNMHIQGMPQGHYFVGLGRRIIRIPLDEEVNLIRAAGQIINPERHVESFKKACIHGTEYRIRNNKRTKFCNFIVFSKDSRFFVIEKILSYLYRNEVVAGVIGILLRSNGNAYRVPHMQRVVQVQEKHFISFSEIRSPGFLIPISENLAAVSLPNVWETD